MDCVISYTPFYIGMWPKIGMFLSGELLLFLFLCNRLPHLNSGGSFCEVPIEVRTVTTIA